MDILTQLKNGVLTSSPEETHTLARAFAQILPQNSTIAFHGDLGSGKTTFIQGLAHAWNISQPITSPTFNLFSTYSGTTNLLHLDAYRLSNQHDLDSLLLEEFLIPPYCLAIEWPDNIKGFIPSNAYHIHCKLTPSHQRFYQLKSS